MSQSASLTKALEAVERVLNANTGDMRELAEIAGVDAQSLFFQADLTGLDLRGMEIDFLLPLQTKFEGAKLTNQQLRKFRKADRNLKEVRMRKKIVDLRTEAVSEFLNWYTNLNRDCISVLGGDILTTEFLRDLLLSPLVEQAPKDDPITPNYTNSALSEIAPWVSLDNFEFLLRYFHLLGDLQVPTNARTEEVFGKNFFLLLEEKVGELIVELHPTYIFDNFWLSLRGPTKVLEAARLLGARRLVDAAAIENNLDDLDWEPLLTLFDAVPFDCDADRAERMSTHLTRQNWPAAQTTRVLRVKAHPKVRTALFRQLLAQGDQERVAEVIRWLEDQRGAAGALSLENAFAHIEDFDLAIQLANDLGPRLAANQIRVIENALFRLASSSEDRSRYRDFRTRFGS